MPDVLQVVEGVQLQSKNEEIKYTVDTDNYPPKGVGVPTSASATVFDVSDDSDVTSTVMPDGSVSIATTIITLKPLKLLDPNTTYRIQVKFTKNTNIWEPYFNVRCPY